MKTLLKLLFLLLAAYAGNGCNKKEDNPVPVPVLEVSGLADTSIVAPSTSIKLTTNLDASYGVNKPAAGNINSDGLYQVGLVDGVYKLVVKNAVNAGDSVTKTVVVSKYADLFNSMKNGGYLLSFRHGNAFFGTDKPNSTVQEWWKSCDSALARQLTPGIGIEQSDTTGSVLRLLQLPFDTLMTSVYCRCVKTAEAFNLPIPIKQYEEISQHYDEPNRYVKTMQLYGSKAITEKNTLAVTHAGFANVPTGTPINIAQMGDCVVFKLNGNGIAPTYITTINIAYWLTLGRR